MALAAGGPAPDRQPSPNRLTLSSNNPFRNRASSPSPPVGTFPPPSAPQAAPQRQAPPRPSNMSKNPFLDASEVRTSPQKANTGGLDDIFKELSVLDKPPTNGAQAPPRAIPPSRTGTLPPASHKPSGSAEPRERPPRPPRGPDVLDKRDYRPRARGMSESSVMEERERLQRRERERVERPPRTESEERRRRERRREREERHRRERERSGKTRKAQGLDIIDKLDVTGIYGQGLIHHDGPFDACNPHRNKASGKSRRPAPMQAFAADSANMMMGGSGPLRSRLDLDKIHGTGEEGFQDYAATRRQDTQIVNTTERFEQVHGDPTAGLGTSTFLEGAPASRRDVQRRESEDQEAMYAQQGIGNGGGLGRKKSLAQRFRGMSATRKMSAGAPTSPDARYHNEAIMDSPPAAGSLPKKAISAGGHARANFSKENEVNPFDNEYDNAFDKKGTQIRIAEQERPSANRPQPSSSSRGPGLSRSVTSDSAPQVRGATPDEERPANASGPSGGGGFLSRMKSLKGGRRARPERREM